LNKPENADVHKFYSLERRWCYLSYCGERYRIDDETTWTKFLQILKNCKQHEKSNA